MKTKILIYGACFSTLVILLTVFILFNSTKGNQKSHEISNAITEIIDINKSGADASKSINVRKIAHVVEFSALGMAVICLSIFCYRVFNVKTYGTAFFYVLAVAVADEHIQSFSDRSSSTSDIILDFFGALIGFCIVGIIVGIISAVKSAKNLKN